MFFRTLNVMHDTNSIDTSTQITDEAGAVIPFAAVEIRDEFAEAARSEADAEGLIELELPHYKHSLRWCPLNRI